MQRRAAAAYVAFFLVIAAGSYAFIATADAPEITISGDNVQEIQEEDSITVDGRTYTVTEVSAEVEEGGDHGGGGGIAYHVTFQWTNESALYTETWTSNTTIDYEGQTRRVLTQNGTDDVVLRWEPGDEYAPSWVNGTQYVDGHPDQAGRQDVPVTEFIANSNNDSIGYVNLTEGQTLADYNGNETTVANVSNTSVRLEWTAPRDNTVESTNNQNITLNEQPYVVHFKNNNTVLLGQGTSAQQQLQDAIETNDRFHDRINGVWGVTIGSGTAALLLIALAFLPRKE